MEDFRFVRSVLKAFYVKLPSVKQHFEPKREGSPFQKSFWPPAVKYQLTRSRASASVACFQLFTLTDWRLHLIFKFTHHEIIIQNLKFVILFFSERWYTLSHSKNKQEIWINYPPQTHTHTHYQLLWQCDLKFKCLFTISLWNLLLT